MTRLLDRVQKATLYLGVAILAFMLALTVTDVTLRYTLNKPFVGTTEVTQYALALLIFAGLAVITREKSHIVVSLFEPFMLRRLPRLYNALFSVFNLAGPAILAYLLLRDGAYLIAIDQRTIVLEMRQGWFEVGMGALAFIAALFGLERAIGDFSGKAVEAPHDHEAGM